MAQDRDVRPTVAEPDMKTGLYKPLQPWRGQPSAQARNSLLDIGPSGCQGVLQ